MRVAIVNDDYPLFQEWLYRSQPGLAESSYAEQIAARNHSLFGMADFYSRNLQREGIDAGEIHFNNVPLQARWAVEHPEFVSVASRRRILTHQHWRKIRPRLLSRVLLRGLGLHWRRVGSEILAAQFRWRQPSVVLEQNMIDRRGDQTRRILPPGCALIGESDAAFRHNAAENYGAYDWVRCSLKAHLGHFARASHYRFAFEASILESVAPRARDLGVTFVGSLGRQHRQRVEFLEAIAKEMDFSWWGPGTETLPAGSMLHGRYQGQAWGREMYEVLARSAIVLNRQIDSASGEADNMRMFETTGMGALLMTDEVPGLGEQFVPDEEVVPYRSPEDCVQKVAALLNDEPRRKKIAAAGQARTLRDHTYAVRMKELATLLRTLANETKNVPAGT